MDAAGDRKLARLGKTEHHRVAGLLCLGEGRQARVVDADVVGAGVVVDEPPAPGLPPTMTLPGLKRRPFWRTSLVATAGPTGPAPSVCTRAGSAAGRGGSSLDSVARNATSCPRSSG